MAPAVKDLGTLSGDILVYGGPYSNLEATEALFSRADTLGIPPERRICTGDVVGYCADPVAVLMRVFANGGTLVAGNVERQIAAGRDECGCGFAADTACDLLSRGWYPYARAAVDRAGGWDKRLQSLSDIALFISSGRRVAVIHGGVRDISRFIWPTSPDVVFEEEFETLEDIVGPVDAVIAGHAGIAFHRAIGDRHWINAGVVGLPANNGSVETRFLVLSADDLRIESLAYDHALAGEKMVAAGLTQGYHTTLSTGWWPSEDVLPRELRRCR
ncbi:metallophosphoesterase family protein [Ovoidimarina sediminis]|uniref:metallophosphoesterase family protein n=1 Tax=Ovoidimarina sediminis TaxID=3079856 RepID=UPI0029150D3E|nr:metallophosphoesterase [Rhodophyticola sp. MJ-SS7]MDU8942151.1 metallophosphoesterase [Rhodophyticola sp. MJ-SS7]